jgi:type I restriction-modification system DNA methylase subunit
VGAVTRLCAMNLLLHGIGGDKDGELPVVTKDALAAKHGEYDVVLANPPFGKKSSVTIVNASGEQEKESLAIHRDDFWATTSNKQLNFLQHFVSILKQHGRAAVVLPGACARRNSRGAPSEWSRLHRPRRARYPSPSTRLWSTRARVRNRPSSLSAGPIRGLRP